MEPRRYGPFPYTPINRRPKLVWPNGAHVAVWVCPNIEVFALNEPVPRASGKVPDVPAWSLRDYGARIGIFRIMEVLSKRGIRATASLNAEVCDAYPQIIEDAVALGWEFLAHGQSNSRPLSDIPPETERQVIHDSVTRLAQATGRRPRGWLGSGMMETWNSLEYFAQEGIEYCCDWNNDDQPYLMELGGPKMVALPYSMEINDLPAMFRQTRSSDEFEAMMRRQFDTLYREGAESGRVMAIAVHPYVIGFPHRIWALESALDYIRQHDAVWFATAEEIVDHYRNSGATF
jgi:allantoinase